MKTWVDLMKRCAADGVTVELIHDAVAMLHRTDWRAYNEYRMKLPSDAYRHESAAMAAVLADIKRRLEGHKDHGSTSRHWIASRDVVVTGPTNDDGVPTKCTDPICHEWNMLLAAARKAKEAKEAP